MQCEMPATVDDREPGYHLPGHLRQGTSQESSAQKIISAIPTRANEEIHVVLLLIQAVRVRKPCEERTQAA